MTTMAGPHNRLSSIEGWSRWCAVLALPALFIGIALYPNIQLATMPTIIAAGIIGAVAAGLILSGHPRRLILLPVVASFLPSATVGFLALLVTLLYFLLDYGAARVVRPLDRVDWSFLAVLAWICLNWLVNLGVQTDLWSLPVYLLTFMSPWLILFVARAAPWTREDLRVLLRLWFALVVVQLAPALIKPVVTSKLGTFTVPLIPFELMGMDFFAGLANTQLADYTTGTMVAQHHLGIALLLGSLFLITLRVIVARRWIVPLALLLSYVFLMTDSKHVMLAAVPAGIIYLAFIFLPSLRPRTRRALTVLLVAVGVVGGSYLVSRTWNFVVQGFWRPYFVLAQVNPKVQLYVRTATFLSRDPAALWFGLGPGSFASRAASIRATEVLFKEEGGRLPLIPAYTSPAYASVMRGLYTSRIVDTARNRSGALTNPFSSLVGLVAEYGIVGVFLIGLFLVQLCRAGLANWRAGSLDPEWRAAGATLFFSIPFLITLGLFDSYFEQPDVVSMLLVLAILTVTVRSAPEPAMTQP